MKTFFMLVQKLLAIAQRGCPFRPKNYPELFMPSCYSVSKLGILGVSLALACAAAEASSTTYFATQGPKTSLTNPTPPVLNSSISSALAGFNAAITSLGRNEYELGANAGPGTFSYTGGTATLTGGNVVGVAQSPTSLGRYNMTSPVATDPISGGPGSGHWLEGSADFSYSFSSAITALGFFGTDFGDLNGSFELDLFSGSTMIYSTVNITNTGVNKGNGNLLFFGYTSDVAFDKAVFKITQATGATTLDVLGFDSLIVGTANVNAAPEPTSLALAGLALAAAGFAARRTRRA